MTKLLIPPLSPLLSILILHLLLFLHLSPPFIVWTFSANANSSSSTSTSASFYLSFFYWLIFLALDLLSRSNGEKLGPATEAALDQTRLIVETAHNIVDSKQVWNIVLLSCWLLILIFASQNNRKHCNLIANLVVSFQIMSAGPFLYHVIEECKIDLPIGSVKQLFSKLSSWTFKYGCLVCLKIKKNLELLFLVVTRLW